MSPCWMWTCVNLHLATAPRRKMFIFCLFSGSLGIRIDNRVITSHDLFFFDTGLRQSQVSLNSISAHN
ncbi:hypothetical protein CERSUDRAFT_111929 [Gelatoporia subvermispora B]|uniref:Uncharacterized protein n=1 Tax=Ceriporiopsis subvermispora (strain B) TaxID=914234 RepID=M2R4X2_CERS8|nr:hypothetical protein CERSUDRAFT_111929 [Gelatoporia subvermispora B]